MNSSNAVVAGCNSRNPRRTCPGASPFSGGSLCFDVRLRVRIELENHRHSVDIEARRVRIVEGYERTWICPLSVSVDSRIKRDLEIPPDDKVCISTSLEPSAKRNCSKIFFPWLIRAGFKFMDQLLLEYSGRTDRLVFHFQGAD